MLEGLSMHALLQPEWMTAQMCHDVLEAHLGTLAGAGQRPLTLPGIGNTLGRGDLTSREAIRMHQTGGPAWGITMDTSGPMLIALYVRDAAGLDGAGRPALSHAAPKVHRANHNH